MFGLVRNPIYTAMLIFEFGIALLAVNFVTIAGFLLAFAALELQVRRVEEPYLLAKHDATYRDYIGRVGRFSPWHRADPLNQSCGISRSIASSQACADMSDGARQSPRGESDPP